MCSRLNQITPAFVFKNGTMYKVQPKQQRQRQRQQLTRRSRNGNGGYVPVPPMLRRLNNNGDEVLVPDELEPVIDDGELLPIIDDGELLPIIDDGELLPIIDDGELLPIIDDGDLQPIPDDDGELQPIPDDGDLQPIPDEEVPDETDDGEVVDPDVPDEEEKIPQSNKCSWGPVYYCQSEDVFTGCGRNRENFSQECDAIRTGMVTKCEDLGKGFWCSNITNFNYCVKSQGFEGDISSFEACKPSQAGGRKNCKKCGKCITKIYNVNSCACDHLK